MGSGGRSFSPQQLGPSNCRETVACRPGSGQGWRDEARAPDFESHAKSS